MIIGWRGINIATPTIASYEAWISLDTRRVLLIPGVDKLGHRILCVALGNTGIASILCLTLRLSP